MTDKFKGGAEIPSNWYSFKEKKIGDGIKGTLLGKKFVKSTTPAYQDQWVYELKNEDDGQQWFVGISVSKVGTVSRLNKCQEGEIISIVFDAEGPSAVKGGKPAKYLKVLTYGMDTTYNVGEEVGATIEIE